MGLIVSTYLFALLLVWNTIYLSVNKSKRVNVFLNKVALPAALVAIGIALTIHLSFYNRLGTQRVISTLAMCFMVITSYAIFNFSISIPDFKINKILKVLNLIIHSVGIWVVLFGIERFYWNALRGFHFYDRTVIGNLTGIRIFIYIYIVAMPIISMIGSLIKVFFVKNNIHRQQLVLHSLALGVCLTIWIVMIYIFRIFSWTFALLPGGYIFLLVLDNAIFNLTRVFDIKQIALGLIRFFLFTVIFSVLAGIFAAIFMDIIFETEGWIVSITAVSIFILFSRDFLANRFNYVLGKNADYEYAFDASLQALDYTAGHDAILDVFPKLMKQYVTCKGLDILITDDKMNLQTIYSDLGHWNSMDAHLPCFEFLLNQNTILITKNELIANYLYHDVKDTLLEIFDSTESEVLICIREGQKLIACILLYPKMHSAEYSRYDIRVLSSLYSYFFLVMYYLRNIAKQDITITVDREIEMADQIIGSIQKYQDKLDSPYFTMDSISYSAHQLGGDFIDYITLNDRRAMFLIGDVAGKGLSASMSMVILKSVIHTYLQETSDFKELVSKVNIFVKKNLPRGTFFAGLFGIIDFPTNTIYYLNCGIPLMSMYIQSYKNAIEIQGEGKVLGFAKDIKPFLKVRKITMHKGDVIVLTTDGLLDAANLKGERFGSERVGRLLQEHAGGKASYIARAIYNKLLDFILRKIDDDVTVLVIKYDEPAGQDTTAG